MHERYISLIDALEDVKLLPLREAENDVLYGYVSGDRATDCLTAIIDALQRLGYDVHSCQWPAETVLLAIGTERPPVAIRITSSPDARYSLYTLSRPATAQALWQWSQVMRRQILRQQRFGP